MHAGVLTEGRRCRRHGMPPRAEQSTLRSESAAVCTHCLSHSQSSARRGEEEQERELTHLDGDDGPAFRYLVRLGESNDLVDVWLPARVHVSRVRAHLRRGQARRPEREPARGRLCIDLHKHARRSARRRADCSVDGYIWTGPEDNEYPCLLCCVEHGLQRTPVVEVKHARRRIAEAPFGHNIRHTMAAGSDITHNGYTRWTTVALAL